MNRRDLYRLVTTMLPAAGGARPLLDAIGQAMRALRNQTARKSPSWLSPYLDVLHPLFVHDDALGQVYQAINAPALESAYRSTAHQRRKFAADEIPAVTQLFTPRWVVEFLLQNTLGRAWLELHPDSQLKKQWNWLAANSRPQGELTRAIDLRICDPACGTMNFGLVAVDMLRLIYREEMDRAGRAGWPASPSCRCDDKIDQAIVANNLIGFDIDPLAIELARQSLEIKIGKTIPKRQHGLFLRDTLFGPEIKDRFDVVVTNPPYLSARNLDPQRVQELKQLFPSAWRDYYACFILRSLQLLRAGGRAGILTMQSFMFTAAFEKLRRELLESAHVETVAHFGPGVFDIGNPGTLQTAAVVLRAFPHFPDYPETGSENRTAHFPPLPVLREGAGVRVLCSPPEDAPLRECSERQANRSESTFFRLIDAQDKEATLAGAIRAGRKSRIRFEINRDDLASSPRLAWMYWLCPATRRAFAEFPKLGDIAPPRQGLATTDNLRFVRYWWEVEPPGYSAPRAKWMPYAKGGRFRRWYESPRHRVNWENDGREIKAAIVERYPYLDGQWQWVAKNTAWYGREGITYSYLTSGSFSARRLEAGAIFDVAGSSLFPDDPLTILGVLNSSAARRLLAAINPTVNFQVGDLRQLPIPPKFPGELRRHVSDAIESVRQLDRFDETCPEFQHPAPWNAADSQTADVGWRLIRAQRQADQIVADLYGIADEKTVDPRLDTDPAELARRWISYALGVWLGRWGDRPRGELAVIGPLDEWLESDLRKILAEVVGEKASAEIDSSAGGLKRFLETEFLQWHNRLYRGRPVVWGFTGAGRAVAVSGLSADARLMRSAFAAISQKLPDGWDRWLDDGVAINLAPLAPWIADRKLRLDLVRLNGALAEGRLKFSTTARWMAKRDCLNLESICVSVPFRIRKSLRSKSRSPLR